MQEFLLKRMIERLLETAVFAERVNTNFAKRVMELAEEAVRMQENLKGAPERKAAEDELKELING
jgi:hypothetical protein